MENTRKEKRTILVVQSQASLTDQLKELVYLANQNGLYDAADYITRALERKNRW